jgi:hypothetical protein
MAAFSSSLKTLRDVLAEPARLAAVFVSAMFIHPLTAGLLGVAAIALDSNRSRR